MHSSYCGSSPRLWGTFWQNASLSVCERFIPTPVGNISNQEYGKCCLSVHPHACGEHYSDYDEMVRVDGSSPRLWGT